MESLGTILKRVVKVGQNGPYEPEPERGLICPKCQGTGWISRDVRVGDPDFGQAFRCECRFPDMLETLDNFKFDPRYPDLKLAHEATQNWVAGKGPCILVLSGPRGVGKSHLLMATRNALILDRRPHQFLSDHQVDMLIRDSFDDNNTEEVLRRLGCVPNLMIDDYGTVARKDTMEGHMDDTFNLRWIGAATGIRTMITTNQGSDQMSARIRSRLNDRVRSRYLVIDAPDYRLKVREA